MARLTQRQFQTLPDCIGEVYAHPDLNDFAPHALEVAAKVIPADCTANCELNLRRKRLVAVANPASVVAPNDGRECFFRDHPLVQNPRRTGDGPVLRISDFLSRRRCRETGLYRELFRGGVEYQLGCTRPSCSPEFSVALSYNRRRRFFSEAACLALNLLRPHLFQAYRNPECISESRGQTAQANLALEPASRGIITLNARGKIACCPDRVWDWLNAYFGGSQSNQLPVMLSRWLCQQQLPSERSGSLPSPRRSLTVEREGRRLTIRVVAGQVTGQQTLILEEQQAGWSVAPLEQLGLTTLQAEVLLWIAQGKTNPEIGTFLGLSAGTVHKHAEHIYQKLGVETRTAAARRAYEVLGINSEAPL